MLFTGDVEWGLKAIMHFVWEEGGSKLENKMDPWFMQVSLITSWQFSVKQYSC